MYGAASGTYDDPIAIRLYIHLVRLGNGSGGVSPSDLIWQQAALDQVFNSHNIFFDYCVREVNCADCWLGGSTGRQAIKELFITDGLDDGINVFLFPQSFSLTSEAEDVGSKNCFSNVSFSGTAHEIGHCLGLFHTHQGSECPPTIDTEYAPYYDSFSVLVPGANCETAGDMICDTPAEPRCYSLVGSNCQFSNPTPILDYVGNPYIDPDNVLGKNIMSYNICRTEFTPDQVKRIRDILADDMILGAVVSPFSHITHMTGTASWTTPRYFNHDLIVDGFLTISTEVGFTAGHGIIVNGSLKVDGGKLTISPFNDPCPESSSGFWKGILLARSSTVTPSITITGNSTVEFAERAIAYGGSGLQFVVGSNSLFRNNKTSFDCRNTLDGPAKFTRCTFLIDDEYPSSSYFPQIIALHAPPMWFWGCNFIFEPELPATISRQAISAFNSHILLTPYGGSPSRIENWTVGVRSFHNPGSKFTLVRGIEFAGNQRGIYNFGFQRMSVYNNEFDLSNSSISNFAWGIYSDDARDIQFYSNILSSTDSEVYSTGIHVTGTGASNVVIGESDFFDLDEAIYANRAGTQASGLQFLCNRNEGNRKYDFRTEGGISPFQGEVHKPAGNTFSQADNGIDDSDFSVEGHPGNYEIDYFHRTNVSNQVPIYRSNVVFLRNTDGPSCDHFTLFQDPVEHDDLSDFIDSVESIEEEILDKLIELENPFLNATQVLELNSELSYLQLTRDVIASQAVVYTLTRDSLDYDEVRIAINLKDGFGSVLAKAYTYIQEGDTLSFFNALALISTELTLTQSEEDDLEEILWLETLLRRVYLDGRLEDMLTEAELDTMEYLAEKGLHTARLHAQAILCYFYDQCYDVTSYLAHESGEMAILEKLKNETIGDFVLNPLQTFGKWSEAQEVDVLIISVDGRILDQWRSDPMSLSRIKEIPLQQPPGMYFIVINGVEGVRAHHRIVH